ncbi:MAG: SMC-Scp complex subunit ScpB [Syntrophomonadaceae bacterium]|jgi:segregation and condensation protein B
MLMRDQAKGAIEAILFVRSEPISIDELVEILELPLVDLKIILQEMITEYNDNKRGIQIVGVSGGYVMCTRPEYAEFVSRMNRPVKRRLSPAAMETLAIIAYQQPVTRAEIEKIRGVKADKVINSLLDRGLIRELGPKAVAGKPMQYITTEEFLKVFGLASLSELPNIEEA